jgi:hypothetical protein
VDGSLNKTNTHAIIQICSCEATFYWMKPRSICTNYHDY